MWLRRELHCLIPRSPGEAPTVNFNNNYFEIFELPVSFRLDVPSLGETYLTLQKEVHPDRFAAASDGEQRLAMQWTTQLNTA